MQYTAKRGRPQTLDLVASSVKSDALAYQANGLLRASRLVRKDLGRFVEAQRVHKTNTDE